MMEKEKIKAVLFDVDSTLFSYPLMTLILIWKYWPFVPLNAILMQVRKKLRAEGKQGDFRMVQANLFSKKLHIPVKWGEGYLNKVVYRGWNQNFQRVPVRKGVKDFLDLLVKNGIRIGIVSDYPPETKIQQLGLGDYPWEFLINCEVVGALKPNTDAFELALKKLSIPAGNVMFVGDKYDYDILPPASLGMKTAWLSRKRKVTGEVKPDIIFRNFRELKKKFEEKFMQ